MNKKSDRFTTGFFLMDSPPEELFLSVTPGFECGPGIERDGITEPRMRDPHSVDRVCQSTPKHIAAAPQRPTTDAYEQRAGTWTIYHHVKRFMEACGREWRVIAVQSNGDLTMNLWHVAFIRRSHIGRPNDVLCYLSGDTLHEPLGTRVYRSLVKWTEAAARERGCRYDFVDLKFIDVGTGGKPLLKLADTKENEDHHTWMLKCGRAYDAGNRDVRRLVEFALAGKLIIERGSDLSMPSAADRFDDVRHIFALPIVPAQGTYSGTTVSRLNFGEYELFKSINARRAALHAPVVIDLNIENCVSVEERALREQLEADHFREVPVSPNRPGEYRVYSRVTLAEKVEIFFPHSNYPFGAIGLQNEPPAAEPPSAGPAAARRQKIVCLSASGLSGRVGNTLVGVTRMMHHFFHCTDALVLDEGLDVFSLVNPHDPESGQYRYDNDQMLAKVLALTKEVVDSDVSTAGPRMKSWPLNKPLIDELERDHAAMNPVYDPEIVLVRPQRSQVRSVLIFAAAASRRAH